MDQHKTNVFGPLRPWALCALTALLALGSSAGHAAAAAAAGTSAPSAQLTPFAPSAEECFDKAGAYQGVNPLVLRAVAWRESKGDASAINRNANGSIDVGQLQINSIHFPELKSQGIPHRALTDPCVNIFVAAWLLKQKMVRHGNTWRAIGAYHSESPRERDAYARSIQAILASWGLLQPER